MSQLTLDLPESLRLELERQAALEGVSLQHYIVYSLTRFITASDLVSQKISFEEMPTAIPKSRPMPPSGIFCLLARPHNLGKRPASGAARR
jgi:hypothetical protein